MGKSRRLLCMAVPYALSVASLICLIFVGIGCTQLSTPQSELFFMKANTTAFISTLEETLQSMITERSFIEDEIADSAAAAKDAVNESGDITGDSHHDVTSVVTGAVESVADNAKDLAQSVSTELANFKSNASDFYTVGLWGYCKGNIEGGKSNLTECTEPAASFWFNFTEVLDLRASWAEKVFPNQVDRLGGVYKSSSKGVTATYIGAVVATVLLLGSGIISIVSGHLASIVGTLSVVTAIINIASSATATGVYVSLVGVLRTVFRSSGIAATLGQRMLVTSWLATAFSIGASVVWLLGCCCS